VEFVLRHGNAARDPWWERIEAAQRAPAHETAAGRRNAPKRHSA
jgi:hypothetical protein